MKLWDFAVSLYARPGVDTACLTLQDEYAQSVPLLIWRLWAHDRRIDAATVRSAAGLARDWDERVVAPLRSVGRSLTAPARPIADERRLHLRERVTSNELAAERAMLEGLEALTSNERAVGTAAIESLAEVADAWSRPAPVALLAVLAAAAASVTGCSFASGGAAMNYDTEPAEDEASIRMALADLRLAHQDLDAAIGALEAGRKVDQLQIARLKKRKLGLRDQITKLEERLTPDIIA